MKNAPKDPKLALAKAAAAAHPVSRIFDNEVRAKLTNAHDNASRTIKGSPTNFNIDSIRINCKSFDTKALYVRDLLELCNYVEGCLPSFERRLEENSSFLGTVGSWASTTDCQVKTIGASIINKMRELCANSFIVNEGRKSCINYARLHKGEIRLSYDKRDVHLGVNACRVLDIFEHAVVMLGSCRMTLKGFTDLACLYNSIAGFVFEHLITDGLAVKESAISTISRSLVRSMPPVNNDPVYLKTLLECGLTQVEISASRSYRSAYFRGHRLLMIGSTLGEQGFWIANLTDKLSQAKKGRK